jgi:hypothetical protein
MSGDMMVCNAHHHWVTYILIPLSQVHGTRSQELLTALLVLVIGSTIFLHKVIDVGAH